MGVWSREQFLRAQDWKLKGRVMKEDKPVESEVMAVYAAELADVINANVRGVTVRAEHIEVYIRDRIDYNDWEVTAVWLPRVATVYFPEFGELREIETRGAPTPPRQIVILRPNPKLFGPLTKDLADELAYIQIPFEMWSWDDEKNHWIYMEVK